MLPRSERWRSRRRPAFSLPLALGSTAFLLFFLSLLLHVAADFGQGPRSSFFGASGRGAVDNDEYYNMLGIEKTADSRAIKRAYRRLAVKNHPDKGGDPEKFKKLSAAYEALSDPEKRRIYDQAGKAGLEGGVPPPDHGADDLFSMFFGRGRQRQAPSGPRRARDVAYEVEVPLEHLYSGAARKVRLWTTQRVGPDGEVRQVPKEVEMHIEKGMRTGSRIVIPGAAEAGVPGVAPGDIVFVVVEAEHPVFRRVGDHLVADLSVTLGEALTGFSRVVAGLDGRQWLVKGRADRVVRPGEFRVVKGAGMPREGNPAEHGDLFLRMEVVFPTDEESAAWDEEARPKLRKLLPRPPKVKKPPGANVAEAEAEEPDPAVLAGILHQRTSGQHGEGSSFFRSIFNHF